MYIVLYKGFAFFELILPPRCFICVANLLFSLAAAKEINVEKKKENKTFFVYSQLALTRVLLCHSSSQDTDKLSSFVPCAV